MGESIKNSVNSANDDFGAEMWDIGEAVEGSERGFVPDLAAFRPAKTEHSEKGVGDSGESARIERAKHKLGVLAGILTRRDKSADNTQTLEDIQVDVEEWVKAQNAFGDAPFSERTSREETVGADSDQDSENLASTSEEALVAEGTRIAQEDLPEKDFRGEVEFWAQEYNDTERQFANYQETARPFRQPTENQTPPSVEFRETLRKYEEDQTYNWHRLASATNQAQTADLTIDKYAVAKIQNLGAVEPEKTVEAATGIFYHERAFELQQAIRGGDSPTSEAELELIGRTLTRVSEYMIASSDFESRRRDLDYYRVQRQSSHNNMVEHLNNLNALAERYGAERFTFRDFMTNNFDYSQELDHGSYLSHRAKYDRETVLAYFQTAFSQDFAKMQRELF